MKCKKCGYKIIADTNFCIKCGTAVDKKDFKKCYFCGHYIDDSVIYCPSCGIKQDNYIDCKVCGTTNLKTFKFCSNCGSSLYDDSVVKKVPVSAQKQEPIVEEPKINIKEENIKVETPKVIEPEEEYIEEIEENDEYQEGEEKPNKVRILPLIFGCIIPFIAVVVFAFYIFNTYYLNKDTKTTTKQKEKTSEVVESKKTDENTEEKEEVKEETTPEVKKASYYKIEMLETVKLRSTPDIKGEHIGKISEGCVILAFEKKESGGYTWYKLAFDEWVPDDGSFMKVSNYETNEIEIKNQPSKSARAKKDTVIYDAPSSSANSIGKLTSTTLIRFYDTVSDNGTEYYQISPCEYVKASDLNIEK